MKKETEPLTINKLEGNDKRVRRFPEWSGIVVHHTDIGRRTEVSEETWRSLYKNITAFLAKKDSHFASTHYIIGRFGEITQIVDPEKYEAFHAGESQYFIPKYKKVMPDLNGHFIGIELVGDGNLHEYSDEQYQTLSMLCAGLLKKYPSISPMCIVGHEHVSPGRKVGPGKLFNWRRFYKATYEIL